MLSSVKLGTRPRMPLIFSYSSGSRPSFFAVSTPAGAVSGFAVVVAMGRRR
jgi:hypothetical protein